VTENGRGDQLAAMLRDRMSPRWQVDLDTGGVRLRYRRPPHAAPAAPRRPRSSADLVGAMARYLGRLGVSRAPLLPIRWGRETDLTISAVQGLDPWLKDGRRLAWREGFLPQPVVRFTGERTPDGRLKDGYLTAFVNLSYISRIDSVDRHLDLLDTWIGALSASGLHASRLTITGSTQVWRRGPVSGVTLLIDCDGVGLADAVLLWHTTNPGMLASDLGSGLERLRWLTSRLPWPTAAFGDQADRWDVDLLDAVRTATLLAMGGVQPAASGPGHAMRRVLRRVPPRLAEAGLDRLVRSQRGYWADVGMTGPDWPQLADTIEHEVLSGGGSREV